MSERKINNMIGYLIIKIIHLLIPSWLVYDALIDWQIHFRLHQINHNCQLYINQQSHSHYHHRWLQHCNNHHISHCLNPCLVWTQYMANKKRCFIVVLLLLIIINKVTLMQVFILHNRFNSNWTKCNTISCFLHWPLLQHKSRLHVCRHHSINKTKINTIPLLKIINANLTQRVANHAPHLSFLYPRHKKWQVMIMKPIWLLQVIVIRNETGNKMKTRVKWVRPYHWCWNAVNQVTQRVTLLPLAHCLCQMNCTLVILVVAEAIVTMTMCALVLTWKVTYSKLIPIWVLVTPVEIMIKSMIVTMILLVITVILTTLLQLGQRRKVLVITIAVVNDTIIMQQISIMHAIYTHCLQR